MSGVSEFSVGSPELLEDAGHRADSFSVMVCFYSGKGLCPIFLQGVPNFHIQFIPENVNEIQNVQKSSSRPVL